VAQGSNMPGMRLETPPADTLLYGVGDSNQALVISPSVLSHFRRNQQKRWFQKEAGGQLFARLSLEQVVVERATGPRKSDFRRRTLYIPDVVAEQQEIDYSHRTGLHYVGDWHTHPEERPRPSHDDSASIRDSFVKSKHHLNGFLLIIVGTAPFPLGLYVSLNDGRDELVLGDHGY
jgi:integrative and conjugative element protein (TIGR02256 family)